MNNSPQPTEKSGLKDDDKTESTPLPAPPAVSAPTNLICSFCDKKLPLEKYKKCPCMTTFYCMNTGCQKEHWKVHKTEHRKIQKALDSVKNEEVEEDDTKSGSKNKMAPPTIHRKPVQKEGKDECPICLDDIPLAASDFLRFTCCGKGLHHHCANQLQSTKSKNIRDHCPLCRTKHATSQEEQIKRLQKWVKKKKAWAQFTLGNMYEHGTHGIKRDMKRAFVLYKLAAEQGDANAQYDLGVLYRNGDGTKIDEKRALELFTLAADKGLAKAQFNIGAMYANGQGVEQSFATSREWMAKAASQGDENAIKELKRLDKHLKRTTTTSTDDKKETSSNTSSNTTQQEEKDECPICLDELSVDFGKFTRFTCCGKGIHKHCGKQLQSTKSKNIREYCPLCRTKGATTDEESMKQLQKWVKKKKAWAQCHLANWYEHGNGVQKDVKRAFVLYKLAAEQGDANAQCSLGYMYQDGIGTKPDVKRV